VYMPKDPPPLGPPLRAETPILSVADPSRIANLTGVLAVVQESTDGVSLQGVSRCVATKVTTEGKTTMVTIEQLQDRDTDRGEGTELNELSMQLWALAKQLNRVATMAPLDPQMQSNPSAMSDILFDIYCNPVTDWHYVQDFIDTLSVPRRVKRVKELLTRQLDAYTRQQQASRAQEEKFMKQQQKMILMEQLKQVKGEPDEKEALINKFNERLAGLVVPKDTLKIIQDEMHKLQTTETQSAEFGVIRSYLELLTQLPWGKFSPEKLDVGHATRVLQETTMACTR
jgi:ATP-dependent Lon protease